VQVEDGPRVLDERGFPSRQVRRAFAYLVTEHLRPVPRQELAGALWDDDAAPPAMEAALSAVLSKIRAAIRRASLADAVSLDATFGAYQLRLPPEVWIDAEAAVRAVDEAEGLLRLGRGSQGWGRACVAAAIARRPFLPGEEGAWITTVRNRLRATLVRALDCLAEAWLANGEGALAVQAATEVVELEPYRESAHLRLMRVHAALGNRAEALRAYERCREILREGLGADPSPAIEALALELLQPVRRSSAT
jgi:SARP family transcriptional regulator, regulator of embCAB operon